MADSSGNLYGNTARGGAQNAGTVFEICKGTTAITTLVSFDDVNEWNPSGAIVLDSSGNIYGTTTGGGPTNGGAIYEVANGSNTVTTLAFFNAQNGWVPNGLTFDAAGNLYGTTSGTIFEMAAGSRAITTVATLNATTGSFPLSTVSFDAAGNLYGAAEDGGAHGDGTVFEVPKGTNTVTALASFTGANGKPPVAVTVEPDGTVYGTTLFGGMVDNGTIFEIPSGTGTINRLASFDNSRYSGSGSGCYGGVTLVGGVLYGATYSGGANNDGTIFELQGSTITPIAPFNGTNGASPYGGLVFDASGNIYGTATYGANGSGDVFELPNGSATIKPLARFAAAGWVVNGQMTMDASGNFWGVCPQGGSSGYGSVVELPKSSNLLTTVATFTSDLNAVSPNGGLAVDASGNVYGTASSNVGGLTNGSVFEIAHDSSTITILASFNGTNGSIPVAGVTLDSSGNLYGTTTQGGAYNYGTAFEIARGSKTITTLATFNSANGRLPDAAVTFDAAGNLYGTTSGGGPSDMGTVFEIAKGSFALTTLAAFDGTKGSGPQSALVLDPAGNLYGTTTEGGPNGGGTVFEIPKGTNAITNLFSFTSSGGYGNTPGQLMRDGAGNLYVATTAGSNQLLELAPNSAVTLAPAMGSNPSNAAQSLAFTAAVSGGVPDGGAITLVDASNKDQVVATGTLSGGSATLTVPAGTLLAGRHNLIAIYGGDVNFAPSQSAALPQTVQVVVTGVTINGNTPSLAGVQRSMVDSIAYTFSESVNLTGAAATLAIHAGQSGTLPTTLTWTALNANADGSSTQWALTFSGAGVSGGSIADGVYDITLNPTAVTSDANPAVTAQSRPMDTFYRLFGDAQGTGKVNASDYTAFLSTYGLKSTSPGYLGYFAADGSTKIDAADYNAFLANYGKKLSGFTPTI